MQQENLIPAKEFCIHHNIEVSFIHSLNKFGLIEITTVQESEFIDTEQISELEKMIRLHYELEINIEGIEAISHLLNRIENMQHEMRTLKNRLHLYEMNA